MRLFYGLDCVKIKCSVHSITLNSNEFSIKSDYIIKCHFKKFTL